WMPSSPLRVDPWLMRPATHARAGVARMRRAHPGPLRPERPRGVADERATFAPLAASAKTAMQPVEKEIDHRGGVERKYLRDQEPAHDRDAERTAQLRARTGRDHQRQRAEHRRERRHHDRPEAGETGLKDRLFGIKPVVALAFEREVHHHD